MKIISANIKNFRLLKDLDLDFSVDPDVPLTIIRAANETGKTTCQYALMWCLYGSGALPQKGDYSLFPSDELDKGAGEIEVSVEIEFKTEHATGLGKGKHEIVTQVYRLTRLCTERAPGSSGAPRSKELTQMWKVTPNGTERIRDSDVPDIIEEALPESLKDVYFTDGDSAMSFIEAAASQGVKRKRVTNAIEALLGLDTLRRTVKHLDNVANKFSQEIDNRDYANELEMLNAKIGGLEEDIEEWDVNRVDAEKNIIEVNREQQSLQSKIDEVLKLGDKDRLVSRRESAEVNHKRLEGVLGTEYRSIASLCHSETLSLALLGETLDRAKSNLNRLNDKKQLPKVSIPILEDLLERPICFCGSDLSVSTVEGNSRRGHISNAIEKSQKSDAINDAAASLFYRVRSIDTDRSRGHWITKYSESSQSLQSIASSLKDNERELRAIEDSIDSINDTQLEKLRDENTKLSKELQKLRGVEASRTDRIYSANIDRKEKEEDRVKVRNRLGKTNTSASNWDIAKDSKLVFTRIIDVLLKEELKKVSSEMNRIFLSMIGADGDFTDLSSIKRAELTDEFDITVYGHNGHLLNPDQDLNGASRRAITLSFILALTKVSEVEAPNIIDTPLGMMAGYVKQSVLLNTVKEGSQVILFLTHDEIFGVQEIIDKYAGLVFTLTNPGHYPKMLVNKPEVKDTRILRCSCNHRQSCKICERHTMEAS